MPACYGGAKVLPGTHTLTRSPWRSFLLFRNYYLQKPHWKPVLKHFRIWASTSVSNVGQRVTENLFNAEYNVASPALAVVRGTSGLVVSEEVRTYPIYLRRIWAEVHEGGGGVIYSLKAGG